MPFCGACATIGAIEKIYFFKIFARRLSIQKPAIDCQTECQRVAQRPLRICG